MAKGVLKKVAQRLVAGHKHRSNLCQHSQALSTINTPGSVEERSEMHTIKFLEIPSNTDHNSNLAPALLMKPSESSYFKEPIEKAIERMADTEDIRKEIMTKGVDCGIPRNHKIDTHALVKGLMESGFNLHQAEALTMSIVHIVSETSDNMQSLMVSKSQAELTLEKMASQLAILRRDMMIMEKTDFTELITKIERITHELQQIQRTTKDEITKISSDLTLDFNLEKGKVKDMHLGHMEMVERKHVKILEKIHDLEKELQNVRSYINTENAALQTVFERYKSDTIKLAFGAVATCMTIILGFYRLWS